MEKLTIEHLAPYLPYGLKCLCEGITVFNAVTDEYEPILYQITGVSDDWLDVAILNVGSSLNDNIMIVDCHPILRPMSDLTKDEMKELYFTVFGREFIGDNITHREVGTRDERHVLWSGLERLVIYKDGDVGADIDLKHKRVLPFDIVSFYASKHFDVFGLIESGLAIDINTLK